MIINLKHSLNLTMYNFHYTVFQFQYIFAAVSVHISARFFLLYLVGAFYLNKYRLVPDSSTAFKQKIMIRYFTSLLGH